MKLVLWEFLWILTAFSGKGNSAFQADCVTPSNLLGKCIEVRYCVAVVNILKNNDHLTNPKVAQFLREIQCGIQRDSQRVCCDINDIDFGDETASRTIEATTSKLSTVLQPPDFKRLSDIRTCGRLNRGETPKKWIGELWFKVEGASRSQVELKCLGTLISHKHLVVPAHCVASLPSNISLDFVEIGGNSEKSVLKIFIHASYNQPKYSNDIAIIELDEDSDDELTDAVCLPEPNINSVSSLALIKHERSALKIGNTRNIPDETCKTLFNRQDLTDGQFCARLQSNETNYTPFIGAVVLESDRNQQYFFKGFSSIKSTQNSNEDKSFIFTDLFHHMNWIQAAIGNEMTRNSTKLSRIEPSQNLPSCQLSNGETGFCVEFQQCSLYSNAPQPLSQRFSENLNQVKCFTVSLNGSGVCCPTKYLNISDENLQKRKRGVELLDLKTCGNVKSTQRIVGGTKAGLREFPWIGLVKYKIGRIIKFTCGSSLISERYALTCAHCITNLPPGYQVIGVRLNEYNRTTDPDCVQLDDRTQDCITHQDIDIEKLIPHPQYNRPRYANDVGLIRLASEPDWTKGISPICLPINDEMQEVISDKYTVAGFGFTGNNQDSDILLKVLLPKVDKEACQSFHNSMVVLSEGHECYGGEGIRDSCKGDSGNALMNFVNIKGKTKAVQMGIVAAGHSECGQGASGFPGIYSDVKFYLTWILDQLEN